MSTPEPSATRLTFNAIGCAAIAAVSLLVAFSLAFELTSMQPPNPKDPDGPKALGFVAFGVILGALFGVAAIIDLLRTLKKLRAVSAEGGAPESPE